LKHWLKQSSGQSYLVKKPEKLTSSADWVDKPVHLTTLRRFKPATLNWKKRTI